MIGPGPCRSLSVCRFCLCVCVLPFSETDDRPAYPVGVLAAIARRTSRRTGRRTEPQRGAGVGGGARRAWREQPNTYNTYRTQYEYSTGIAVEPQR